MNILIIGITGVILGLLMILGVRVYERIRRSFRELRQQHEELVNQIESVKNFLFWNEIEKVVTTGQKTGLLDENIYEKLSTMIYKFKMDQLKSSSFESLTEKSKLQKEDKKD